MTGTTRTDAWGARRADDRQRRRRVRKALTIAAAVAVMGAASLIGGTTVGSGVTIAPLVTAFCIVAVAAITLGLGWREADEVLRRRALHVFAAVGVVAIVGNPVAEMLGRAFHIPSPTETLWWLSIATGVAVLLVQRWRDREAG
ncbi:hypothetical protein [Sphingomonas phyllosphaerae]|uniref:hypothetical protein n=1 Tax=Sphingomonas phyllosphaerae TaxID=257003 RepID=UPI0012DFBEF4|nr:hypothetical protein [Sphingomonas phyllosphaerae]